MDALMNKEGLMGECNVNVESSITLCTIYSSACKSEEMTNERNNQYICSEWMEG